MSLNVLANTPKAIIVESMESGKTYRPDDFLELTDVAESTLWRYMSQLEDDGLVGRDISSGLIRFYKVDL